MIEEGYLKEYKKIYKEKNGKDISDQETLRQFIKLTTLVKNVYQPIKRRDYEEFQRKSKDNKTDK